MLRVWLGVGIEVGMIATLSTAVPIRTRVLLRMGMGMRMRVWLRVHLRSMVARSPSSSMSVAERCTVATVSFRVVRWGWHGWDGMLYVQDVVVYPERDSVVSGLGCRLRLRSKFEHLFIRVRV